MGWNLLRITNINNDNMIIMIVKHRFKCILFNFVFSSTWKSRHIVDVQQIPTQLSSPPSRSHLGWLSRPTLFLVKQTQLHTHTHLRFSQRKGDLGSQHNSFVTTGNFVTLLCTSREKLLSSSCETTFTCVYVCVCPSARHRIKFSTMERLWHIHLIDGVFHLCSGELLFI